VLHDYLNYSFIPQYGFSYSFEVGMSSCFELLNVGDVVYWDVHSTHPNFHQLGYWDSEEWLMFPLHIYIHQALASLYRSLILYCI